MSPLRLSGVFHLGIQKNVNAGSNRSKPVAVFRVLAWEDEKEFKAMHVELAREHQPASLTEEILVEQMAQSFWLRRRAIVLQNLCFSDNQPCCEQEKQLALYLRYQSTHERAFHKALGELLKLRAEKRKAEIGFEREKRAIAEEGRKQEAHEARTRLTTARAKHAELDFDIKEFVEARLPGHTEIPFSTLKHVLARSIEQFAAELDANPALAKTLKAA
jgi:hypothetical protein